MIPPLTFAQREGLLDPPRGLDEGDRVVGVLLDAGADGQDVRVEDDVLRREADLLGRGSGRRGDRISTFRSTVVGLALLVERHHDDGGAVAPDEPGVLAEDLLAFLEADRVDDALALQALQPGLDHLPVASGRS